MHATALRALTVPRPLHISPTCQIITGVRRPRSRNFHRSAIAYRIPESATNAATNVTKSDTEPSLEVTGIARPENEGTAGVQSTLETNEVAQRFRRRGERGLAARRANKTRETPGVPQLVIPEWFFEENVRCYGEPDPTEYRLDHHSGLFETGNEEISLEHSFSPIGQNMADAGKTDNKISENTRSDVLEANSALEKAADHLKFARQSDEMLKEKVVDMARLTNESKSFNPPAAKIELASPELSWTEKMKQWEAEYRTPNRRGKRYAVRAYVYWEILCSISADLKLLPPKANIKDVVRPDTVLYCPKGWPTNYLSLIVNRVALDEKCDVIRIDVEDFAEIIGEYLGENVAWTKGSIAHLGYSVHRKSDGLLSASRNGFRDEEEADDADENENSLPSFASLGLGPKQNHPRLSAAIAVMQSPSNLLGSQEFSKGGLLLNLLGHSTQSTDSVTLSSTSGNDNWLDYKLGRALDMLVDAASVKRERSTLHGTKDAQNPATTMAPESRGLIIQVNNYKELSDHPIGSIILTKLRETVKRRWFEGQKIVIVGTTADEEVEQAWGFGRNSISTSQPDTGLDYPKVIFVPPEQGRRQDLLFVNDEERSIRALNIRRLEGMIRKLSGTSNSSATKVDLSHQMEDPEISRHVWDYGFVRRIAVMMLGYGIPRYNQDGLLLSDALRHLKKSDEARHEWIKKEMDRHDTIDGSSRENDTPVDRLRKTHFTAPRTITQDKVEKLKDSCNRYEKKLFGGIIDPADIHTTFDDVRASPEIVEALKTLTSLSLIRPESFSYGVLATDKISGLLLYGPPGTGKTLLAKAVAKESGATVLEVSSSEINDMYVGEGEKNVKAVFSLAKKLSPCVVFIDEADALFQTRTQSRMRVSHRELINQFLREWDGMNNLSTFIMVATNRPFDLDEAIMRRLPRRLLVDLPNEKDREAILKIHLKDEVLDDSVSLAKLAKDTPYYSGSDLKNLAVAAALACVREENAGAAAHAGDEPYVFPPKRILRTEHFNKAMDEISASISEDMSTLSAIRKFDEKYGDRKGRRKRGPALGFGGTMDPDIDSDAGRVRKINLDVAM